MMPVSRPARRVLMTTDTVGGVWTYAVELAAALGQYDIQVGIASMGDAASCAQRAQIAALPHVSLFESGFKLEWMEQPWRDVRRAGKWLLNLAKRFEPDVIHLNNYAHGALQWPAPVIVVGHSCVLSWWRAVHREEAPAQYDPYRRAVRAGLAAADVVVAPSRTMLQSLAQDYGPFRESLVIRNGHDPDRFRPESKQPFVFCAGRLWDEAKNIGSLVRIAPRLQWPVYVAGESRHPDGGEVRLDNVRAYSRLPAREMADCYAKASIYALPARYEPFGLSVLEAALSGCALVLGDIASLREIWNGAAMFVKPENHTALIRAINTLAADPRKRERLALLARERARSFTLQAQAVRYVQLYNAVCGETAIAPLAAVYS